MSEFAPTPGALIDRHELALERGGDAFGTTWAARATDKKREVVDLFLVDPYVAQVSEFRDAFLREGAALRRASHPTFLGWTATAVHAGTLYAVRPADETASLGEIVAAAALLGEVLTPAAILRIAMDALSAVGSIHLVAKTALHGDLTPRTVALRRDGTVVVAQSGLGVAASRADAVRAPKRNDRLGYKAPEQVAPASGTARVVGGRADIFSMGVLLWEALAGRRLFDGVADRDVIERVLSMPVPPLELAQPLPAGLEFAVVRALERDVAKRFADTGEFLAALRRVPGAATTDELARLAMRYTGRLLDDRRAELGAAGSGAPAVAASAPATGPAVIPQSRSAITIPLGRQAAQALASSAMMAEATRKAAESPGAPERPVAEPVNAPAAPVAMAPPIVEAEAPPAPAPPKPTFPAGTPLSEEDLTPVAARVAQVTRAAVRPADPAAEPPAAQYVAPQELPRSAVPTEAGPDAKVVLNLPSTPGAVVGAAEVAAARARRRTATVKVARGPELDALLAGNTRPADAGGDIDVDVDVDEGPTPSAAAAVFASAATVPFVSGASPRGQMVAPVPATSSAQTALFIALGLVVLLALAGLALFFLRP